MSQTTPAICDCCGRLVAYVRGSMWHGEDRICRACFAVWYDPSEPIDVTDRSQIKDAVLRAEAAGSYPFPNVRPGYARVVQ